MGEGAGKGRARTRTHAHIRAHQTSSKTPTPSTYPKHLPQAPTPSTYPKHLPKHLPQDNSSLPPFRGEVRWGVGACERAQRSSLAPALPTPLPSTCVILVPRHARAQFRHSCAGRNHHPVIPALPPPVIPALPTRHSRPPPPRHSCAGRNGGASGVGMRRTSPTARPSDVRCRRYLGARAAGSCLRRNDGGGRRNDGSDGAQSG